ncbi:hypothetical protein AGDE_07237 [Angomonas deanei]|nr:hypothetical protein AGDE_07237 [Angomonas deanei]|eukprot:EPY35790.1 hypothetical protein AGDE_07237 [Angomonas deanei]
MSDNGEVKTLTYKSGAVYEGTFDSDNNRSGRGHWRHPNGETYEGEYRKNTMHGLGIYLHADTGKCYLGRWDMGVMQGRGVYYFDKQKLAAYIGHYTNDKKDEDGYYRYESGVVTFQRWSSGTLSSEREATPLEVVESAIEEKDICERVRLVAPKELGEVPPPSDIRTFQFPTGPTYTGQYCGTKKHGQGYWLHPGRGQLQGQFEYNKHQGWGVYITGRNGKRYVGQWKDAKMNGVGVYFFNPEETEYFIGMYRDDKKHGRGMYHFSDKGNSMVQLWDNGTLEQESPADAKLESDFNEALKRIVECVKPFAPNYVSRFQA